MGGEKKGEYLRCCIKLLKLVFADPAPAAAKISHDLNKEEQFKMNEKAGVENLPFKGPWRSWKLCLL